MRGLETGLEMKAKTIFSHSGGYQDGEWKYVKSTLLNWGCPKKRDFSRGVTEGTIIRGFPLKRSGPG